MWQALEEAYLLHKEKYPESKVYAANVEDSDTDSKYYCVELQAEHFSGEVKYEIAKHADTTFREFMNEIESEAKSEGSEAVAELAKLRRGARKDVAKKK